MGTAAKSHWRYTIEEYVRFEEYSNVRHEFTDGQIFLMAGGTPEHGTWTANVTGLLTSQLRGRPCRVQSSDVRIRVKATGLDTYPDLSVVCNRVELDEQDPYAVTNPVVLVEVLSPSTEEYDRGEKLEYYKRIPSLQEVVFVANANSEAERRVDMVRRSGEGWVLSSAGRGEAIRLESIGCDLPVDDVYLDPLAR